MPVSARTLKALMEAGVCGDKLVEIVGLIDADMTPPKDTAAERRRAYDRERKRNSTGNSTGASLTNSTGNSTGIPPETPISRVEDNLLSTEKPWKKENKNLVDFGFEAFVLRELFGGLPSQRSDGRTSRRSQVTERHAILVLIVLALEFHQARRLGFVQTHAVADRIEAREDRDRVDPGGPRLGHMVLGTGENGRKAARL